MNLADLYNLCVRGNEEYRATGSRDASAEFCRAFCALSAEAKEEFEAFIYSAIAAGAELA